MSLVTNKKAGFNYDIKETYSSGMELLGFEVKSLRKGQGSLEGSYVTVRGNEAYLVGAFIPPFQEKNAPTDFDPRRNRKLILTSKEIRELEKIEKTKGLTIVPISVYNKGRFLKLDIGIGTGKKKFDKRESIKKHNVERDIRREYSDR